MSSIHVGPKQLKRVVAILVAENVKFVVTPLSSGNCAFIDGASGHKESFKRVVDARFPELKKNG